MENFISNLANAWTLIDLLIFAVLGLIIYLKNQENKSLSTELNYQEFQNSVLETKFKNEQVKVSQAQIEVENLKFLVGCKDEIIKDQDATISRKNQPRDKQGHFMSPKKKEESNYTVYECVKSDYFPNFTVGTEYNVSNAHSAMNNMICLNDNEGKGCLVYKSAFKPVK